MGKICLPSSEELSLDGISLRESNRLNAEEKLVIRRTLRNLIPVSKPLAECIKKCTKKFYYDKKCISKSDEFIDCDCADSFDIKTFCDEFKSKPAYQEKELQRFIDIIQEELNEALCKRRKNRVKCPKARVPDFCIVPVRLECEKGRSESSSSTSYEFELCSCEISSDEPQTCREYKARYGTCQPKEKPIVFRHFNDFLTITSDHLEQLSKPFKCIRCKADEIGKWGDFLDMVDEVLRQRDGKLTEMGMCHMLKDGKAGKEVPTCCDDVCVMPSRRDKFEDLDRFKGIELFGFSMFCRRLMRWSNCTTKRWTCITTNPHVVTHLPSMSFPCDLRCKAREAFESLQNIQIGRIGWLVNPNAQVIYVCPSKSTFETKCILQDFIRTARPDVSLSRLWIVENNEECFCKDVEEKYRSGCETLFYTPEVYRRVRHLTAGRHGFIIPGVLSKTDVLIACELKTAVIGPCLRFQERLLGKHYVLSLLAEAGIPHPPFVAVRNFTDLCERMAEMMTRMPGRRKRWMVKVNCGFCGNQSALLCLKARDYKGSKEDLPRYLADVLPLRLTLKRGAYKDAEDFFVEIERHGGVLTAYPSGTTHRALSLGCFIEHDTAVACLHASADVLRTRSGCGWEDIGYIIPQTVLSDETVQELVVRLGNMLLVEPYVGFFGVDVVVFQDEDGGDGELNYWVVDIDPYYTDLLSFDDWRRFCLNIPISASFSANPTPVDCGAEEPRRLSLDSAHRHVVCSGKLYISGLPRDSAGGLLNGLCERHGIAYSAKARTGCMICPIDTGKQAFLVFSFCRSRELALRNFVHALKVLEMASVQPEEDSEECACRNNVVNLARDMKEAYCIRD